MFAEVPGRSMHCDCLYYASTSPKYQSNELIYTVDELPFACLSVAVAGNGGSATTSGNII